jgi:DHA1 family tetracycline resistance protein-like MFS transporter
MRKAAAHGSSKLRQLIDSLKEPQFGTLNLVYFLLVTAFSIMTYAFVLFTAFRYGYTAEQNGFLFAYVGLMSVIGQGLLFGFLARRIGEPVLTCIGCFLMAASLFLMPFIGPMHGGLAALLICCTVLSFGNAMASPALTSLVSKITSEHEQGSRLGIMQSGASLARAIGPMIGGVLLNNSVNRIDDLTVVRTFFAASAIMTAALIVSIFAVRVVRNAQAVS